MAQFVRKTTDKARPGSRSAEKVAGPNRRRTTLRSAGVTILMVAWMAVGFVAEDKPDRQGLSFESRAASDSLVVEDSSSAVHSSGLASYYGNELAGNRTASGEVFDPERKTAAHRTLPFGTRLRVTNQRNGKSVIVRINDRGPFTGRRVIDLSLQAAREIGMVRRGIAPVEIEIVE